jgi:tetratricopeptide (TPR) repeat protein
LCCGIFEGYSVESYALGECEVTKMKNLTRSLFVILFSTGLPLIVPESSSAKVRAWEGTVTIPTYGWAEDVNPKFWALEGEIKFSTTVKGSIIYPYTMQDHLYRTKENRTYKALFLENEYLKITCLPELGGRLHSCLDKTEGKEMFHFNKVIKPGMIAMRGAWISGGVEWNAGPQGHTVTILSPVNALIGQNADGSAYLEISNLEKSLRTQWTARVTLHPGKSYLDERIRIFNPTDGMNPYYFWNCTAFPNRAGTRFIYPMSLGTDHNGVQFFSWPIHEGKDLSWLKNHQTWASVFAVDCTFDFFGAYDVDADRGIVQVANHYELGGKKAWTWGTWDFGLVSQKNLSDDDGPYIEVQSGPLPTQSDYGMLLPREEVSWQEWWYPVHGLGDGFEYATRDIVIQTTRKDGELQLRILATGKFASAICTISRERQELLKKRLDLSPESPQVLTLSPAPQSPVDITIKAKNGDVLASFLSPLPVPKVSPPDPSKFIKKPDEQLTVEEKFLKGRKYDLATDRKKARQYYEKAVAEDAWYSPALRALAVLDIEAGLYDDAVKRLEKALNRDSGDGLSWFFLGVNHLRDKRENEALRCASQATRCFGTASLGYDLAGRAYMRLKHYSKAVEAFEKAVQLNPRDIRARNHLLLALYAAGNRESAYKQAKERIVQNPTDLVPRALTALKSREEMNRFVRESRAFVGEDEFEMLQTSLVFAELGLVDEAARILLTACVEAVPPGERSPLPLYYLAYFSSLKEDWTSARAYLSQAAATCRDYVFPSRPEEVEVLRYAVDENPGDTCAHLHLGNLYANLGRLDEAARHWRRASELNHSLSIAFRNLGLYVWAIENNLAKAEDLYAQAIAARPKDQTLYRDLADILLADNKRPKAIEVLQSAPFEKVRRADVTIMLAQAYLDEHRFTETIDLLESTPYFVNWEGQTIVWDIFNKAHLERGQKRFENKDFQGALQDFEVVLTYPENIGVGRSNKPQEAPAQYWRGKALEALGQLEHAHSAWKEGAAGPEGSEEQNKYRELCEKMLQKTK